MEAYLPDVAVLDSMSPNEMGKKEIVTPKRKTPDSDVSSAIREYTEVYKGCDLNNLKIKYIHNEDARKEDESVTKKKLINIELFKEYNNIIGDLRKEYKAEKDKTVKKEMLADIENIKKQKLWNMCDYIRICTMYEI